MGVTRFYDSLEFVRAAVLANESVVNDGAALLAQLRALSFQGVAGTFSLNSYGSFSR